MNQPIAPNFHALASRITRIGERLRGPYRQSDYADVILPMLVIRRIECLREPTRLQVHQLHREIKHNTEPEVLHKRLCTLSGLPFYNCSALALKYLILNGGNLANTFKTYLNGFSPNIQELLELFESSPHIDRLHQADLLIPIIEAFADLPLHPETLPNFQMGLLFEEVIRQFNSNASKHQGEYFTPQDVVALIAELIATVGLPRKKQIRIYDPTCGTGGLLSQVQQRLADRFPKQEILAFGQELNPRSYAIAAADWLMKGQSNAIRLGNTLTDDQFPDTRFHVIAANPPFGVYWKPYQQQIKAEHKQGGRFAAGLPRVSDGSLLFLQHCMSKLAPRGRLAIVLSGSALFTGDAGSGESNVRRWIFENDLLEAIIALPEQLFVNTGIGTYLWILTNQKHEEAIGKVQLIDARERFSPIRRSIGEKRRELSAEQIAAIVHEFVEMPQTDTSKVFENAYFGYRKVPIERPKESDQLALFGTVRIADPELRDYEKVPLNRNVQEYFACEVLPHVPDAWIDESGIKIGYEINFNREFYQFTPPRPLEDITADIIALEAEIHGMLQDVLGIREILSDP